MTDEAEHKDEGEARDPGARRSRATEGVRDWPESVERVSEAFRKVWCWPTPGMGMTPASERN